MKEIFVDELPKDCFECPCWVGGCECNCGLMRISDDYKDCYKFNNEENCPLKLIADHDTEVCKAERERVFEEIREEFEGKDE